MCGKFENYCLSKTDNFQDPTVKCHFDRLCLKDSVSSTTKASMEPISGCSGSPTCSTD